jgi:hypothetical protein
MVVVEFENRGIGAGANHHKKTDIKPRIMIEEMTIFFVIES